MSWTPRASNSGWLSVASSADGNKLVALAGFIYTSTDSGVIWTPHGVARGYEAVASSADGSKLIAVVLGGRIYLSTDSGVSWTARGPNENWETVASSADGSKLVAAVFGGFIYTSTPTPLGNSTTTGTTGYLLGGQSTAIELQYIGNGQFLPLSHEGVIVGN